MFSLLAGVQMGVSGRCVLGDLTFNPKFLINSQPRGGGVQQTLHLNAVQCILYGNTPIVNERSSTQNMYLYLYLHHDPVMYVFIFTSAAFQYHKKNKTKWFQRLLSSKVFTSEITAWDQQPCCGCCPQGNCSGISSHSFSHTESGEEVFFVCFLEFTV